MMRSYLSAIRTGIKKWDDRDPHRRYQTNSDERQGMAENVVVALDEAGYYIVAKKFHHPWRRADGTELPPLYQHVLVDTDCPSEGYQVAYLQDTDESPDGHPHYWVYALTSKPVGEDSEFGKTRVTHWMPIFGSEGGRPEWIDHNGNVKEDW